LASWHGRFLAFCLGYSAACRWRSGRIDAADAFALTLGAALVLIGVWLHYQQIKLNRKR